MIKSEYRRWLAVSRPLPARKSPANDKTSKHMRGSKTPLLVIGVHDGNHAAIISLRERQRLMVVILNLEQVPESSF